MPLNYTTTLTSNVFLEDLIFGTFNNQPIPSTYSYLTNYYDDSGTPIDAAIEKNKVLEDTVRPNNEINDDYSLDSDIYLPPPQIKVL